MVETNYVLWLKLHNSFEKNLNRFKQQILPFGSFFQQVDAVFNPERFAINSEMFIAGKHVLWMGGFYIANQRASIQIVAFFPVKIHENVAAWRFQLPSSIGEDGLPRVRSDEAHDWSIFPHQDCDFGGIWNNYCDWSIFPIKIVTSSETDINCTYVDDTSNIFCCSHMIFFFWLVVGVEPLWKRLEWKSIGMMKFPIFLGK